MASEDNDNSAPDSWEQSLNDSPENESSLDELNSTLSYLNVNAAEFVPGQNVHAPEFVPSFMKDPESLQGN